MTRMGNSIRQLGEQLRELREFRGWSLREAEAKTGVSNGYIYLLESGRISKPSPKILEKLAAAYEFDYERLLQFAGYLGSGERAKTPKGDEILLNLIKTLTEDQREEVKNFARYLASKK